jgi:hypothetical protein
MTYKTYSSAWRALKARGRCCPEGRRPEIPKIDPADFEPAMIRVSARQLGLTAGEIDLRFPSSIREEYMLQK